MSSHAASHLLSPKHSNTHPFPSIHWRDVGYNVYRLFGTPLWLPGMDPLSLFMTSIRYFYVWVWWRTWLEPTVWLIVTAFCGLSTAYKGMNLWMEIGQLSGRDYNSCLCFRIVFSVVLSLAYKVQSFTLSCFCPFQCKVQVKLELGHRVQQREKETSEDFTHDWTVFVRGPQSGDIQHLVEKVVFQLHESYPKLRRGMTQQ